MLTTILQWEVTDTLKGKANYWWVRRGSEPLPQGREISDLAVVRKVKKILGWNGVRCLRMNEGDMISLRPYGKSQVCFIRFHIYGRASNGF